MAAVVLPLPAPVCTMIRPLRISVTNLPPRISRINADSVSPVIGMSLEDCKCPVELFQQNHTGELVGEGHLAEGEDEVGGVPALVGEAVGGTDGEEQLLGAAVLLVAQQFGELLGGELAAALVEQDERGPRAPGVALSQLQERLLAGQLVRLGGQVALQAPEVLLGEGADGGLFGFADPGDAQFHRTKLAGRGIMRPIQQDTMENEVLVMVFVVFAVGAGMIYFVVRMVKPSAPSPDAPAPIGFHQRQRMELREFYETYYLKPGSQIRMKEVEAGLAMFALSARVPAELLRPTDRISDFGERGQNLFSTLLATQLQQAIAKKPELAGQKLETVDDMIQLALK